MNEGPGRVLGALRHAEGRPCSGEALSSQIGVSRAQIWKHVESLRKRGYEIDGEPGGGYRLRAVPDRLYPEEIQAGLATRWLARSIEYREDVDSTNRLALELARGGAEHGTTVIAEGQSAGRGRLGRSFFSPPHRNLYTSIVLRPDLTTVEAPTLILASAVATAEAVAAEVGRASDVEIKWPNDVLLGGLKTSGILMEMSAEATRVGVAVLGIGVNLNVDREAFPDEFRALATSLRSHTGRVIERAGFARRLFGILEDVLDSHAKGGFAQVRPRFEALFRMTGRRIAVSDLGGARREGRVLDIAPDGALRIERDDGSVERVVAGDVTVAKERATR